MPPTTGDSHTASLRATGMSVRDGPVSPEGSAWPFGCSSRSTPPPVCLARSSASRPCVSVLTRTVPGCSRARSGLERRFGRRADRQLHRSSSAYSAFSASHRSSSRTATSLRRPRRTTFRSGAMCSCQKSQETPSAAQASSTLSAKRGTAATTTSGRALTAAPRLSSPYAPEGGAERSDRLSHDRRRRSASSSRACGSRQCSRALSSSANSSGRPACLPAALRRLRRARQSRCRRTQGRGPRLQACRVARLAPGSRPGLYARDRRERVRCARKIRQVLRATR